MDNVKRTSRVHAIALALGLFALLGGSAWAAKGVMRDNRVSMHKARQLAARAAHGSEIPVYVDQEVLNWLNRGVGTERGRLYYRAALRRMEAYRPMIQERLERAHLPAELLAVPLLESGYQNYDNGTAAGIWSFVPDTARNYGLRVDDQVDERSDAVKLTQAAVAYYSHLSGIPAYRGNWYLALIAYNAGERKIIQAVEEVGSTDAREVLRRASGLKEETIKYLPRFMASLIILRNPELLK